MPTSMPLANKIARHNHGLSCSRSAGLFSRHSTINDITRRSLAAAHVPAVLDPIGLARSDGKIPDGMTLIPWRLGRSLVWDATCVDTLAASHIQATSSMVGAAAASAEQAKRRKYENLDSSFIFVPFGVETLGPCGPEARALFKELSKRVIESSGEPRAGNYLGQRISLAIQRGNAASILGTIPRCGGF
ncbi:jg17242 [Pararge aegeria aegeria]|uniref:Jg17242 protein n=1 Tax=Pararge aegeria aegeria TaxID=348720 RepID=A0A8S4RIJ8_9NEOP|nr:jg17242 [Pararge aegeria aegeria]